MPRTPKDLLDRLARAADEAGRLAELAHATAREASDLAGFAARIHGCFETPRKLLQVVQRVVTRHLLDGAGLKAEEGQGGAVTLIQRFG